MKEFKTLSPANGGPAADKGAEKRPGKEKKGGFYSPVKPKKEETPDPGGISLSNHRKERSERKPEKKPKKKHNGFMTMRRHGPKECAKYPFHKISPVFTERLPSESIEIKAAPNPEKPQKMNWLAVLAPPASMLLVMLIMILVMGSGSASSFLFMLPTSLISVVVTYVNYRRQKKEVGQSSEERERNYCTHLDESELKIAEAAEKQRRILNSAQPPAGECAAMNADSVGLWNRSVNHKSFMTVRIGVGEEPLCISVKAPEKHYDRDVPLEDRAREIAERYKSVSDVPKTLDLKNIPSVGIVGSRSEVVAQTRSLIVNATAMHSYEDLKLLVVYPKEERDVWEQIRWLPHAYNEKRTVRLVADSLPDAKAMLNELDEVIENRVENLLGHRETKPAAPHYLVIIADMSCLYGSELMGHLTLNKPELSVSTVFLAKHQNLLPSQCKSVVELADGAGMYYLASESDLRTKFRPDRVSQETFDTYCRTMAPIRIDGAKTAMEIPKFLSFLDMWKVDAPEELQVEENWKRSQPSVSMEVPLGAVADGEMFSFNIHRDVHGVHGMFVGGTGSGKSSIVRSWILSMATQFSPRYVNFVLVDFKGSGLLDGLEKLPHVVGTISNLDSDIRRNLTALESEIERREHFFRETGGNIYSCYEEGNREMPYLFVVIDELNEFKMWAASGDDNRMNLLGRISQVGNALGIQLIAGSQTSAPFTEVMQSNASFRWCMRTETVDDSRYLLKTEDAFKISKETRGRGFVRVGANEVYEEIQPAFADGTYYTPEELAEVPETEMALLNLQGARSGVKDEMVVAPTSCTQLKAVVKEICATAESLGVTAPRKIWPERLPKLVYLRDLQEPKEGELKAAVGLVDDPKGQHRYTLQIDLKKNGHVVLYGAPRMGKTEFLRTAALSLLTHVSPDRLDVYMLGNGLEAFWGFPQVIRGADTFNPKAVITAVHKELMRRKKNGLSKEDPAVVLFIDGIGQLMTDWRAELVDLAQFGGECGVYIFATAGKLGDVAAISAYLTRGYALWFDNSVYEYRAALSEPSVDRIPSKDISGRGVFCDGRTMDFQTALPYATKDELDQITAKVRSEYKRRKVTNAEPVLEPGTLLIGATPDGGDPVTHDIRSNPSLLILGNDKIRRGKLLHSLCAQLVKQPDVFRVIGIDVDPAQYAAVPGMVFLRSGCEVDEFLANMYDEAKRRNDLKKADASSQFDKFIFIVEDWKTCMQKAAELTQKRFAVNILQKGSLLGIQIVAGCAYEDFSEQFGNDEIGATQLLGLSCCAMLHYAGNPLAQCHEEKFGKAEDLCGDLFVTGRSVEQVKIAVEGE